jgi:hypothetical protein
MSASFSVRISMIKFRISFSNNFVAENKFEMGLQFSMSFMLPMLLWAGIVLDTFHYSGIFLVMYINSKSLDS